MTAEPARRAGRPRSEKARQAILTATLQLAADREPHALTIDAIAKRANVSKETIYRWWRSKPEVVLEALAYYGDQTIPAPNSGSFADDLGTFMRATSAALDLPTRQQLRSLASAAAADASFADRVRDQFLVRRRAALAHVLDQAVKRGELTPERAAIAIDLAFGSLWYRLIFGTGPLNLAWADAVTDAITALTRGN
jgi:AcrR family transcriptional regulator